jgi:hypothetical protein
MDLPLLQGYINYVIHSICFPLCEIAADESEEGKFIRTYYSCDVLSYSLSAWSSTVTSSYSLLGSISQASAAATPKAFTNYCSMHNSSLTDLQ